MAFKSTTLNVSQYFEAMSGLGDISEKQSNFVDAEKIWIELIVNTISIRNSASTLLFMTILHNLIWTKREIWMQILCYL